MDGNDALALREGSRIAVIGGGPAGCFFAHFAMEYAARRGITLTIVLYEGRSFVKGGPPGCNMCAGVLAATLIDRLREMGLELPPNVIQRRVTNYRLVTPAGSVTLEPPAGSGPIYTVFRGGGPRGSTIAGGFDAHLLAHTLNRGVEMVPSVVSEIQLPTSPGEPVGLRLASGEVHAADLVVGAFGIHSPLARMLAGRIPGYRPPESTRAFQMELPIDEASVDRYLGGTVHVFSLGVKGINFAALTPKRSHVTATLVGQSAGPEAMQVFLNHPLVRQHLPPGWQLPPNPCHCLPRLPFGPARHPYGDRIVLVGDASVSRLYKNGLESAYTTSRAAAETAVLHGISLQAFEQHYAPVCRQVAGDSLAGRALFWLKDELFERGPLAAMLVRAAREEQRLDPPDKRPIGRALWGIFTGDQQYRVILRNTFRPLIQAHFWRRGVPALWNKMPPETSSGHVGENEPQEGADGRE